MKTITRIKWLGLILLISGLFSTWQPSHAQQPANGVNLSIQAGYDGYYRATRWVPILINASNNGPSQTGELRVSTTNTPSVKARAYITPLDLGSQARKQLFLYINLDDYANVVQVEFVTEQGIIASASQTVNRIDPSDALFVVITDSPRGPLDLRQPHGLLGLGKAYQVNWHIENIPSRAQALYSIDALILHDIDTGKLSASQRQALQDWTLDGGHLIVAGGPNWQRTQIGINPILPFTPTTTTTLTSLSSLAAFAGQSIALTSTTPIIVTQGQVKPASQVLVRQGDIPLVVRGGYGQGLVDYLAVDPSLAPFQNWAERSTFWTKLLEPTRLRPTWTFGVQDQIRASQAGDFIKGLQLPDVLQLFLFLGIYIILIGPVNYLLLRWLRKLEWAWLTIPVIILLTSIFAYLTGFNLRGTRATINQMAMVQVWPSVERGRVDGIIGVLAPRRGTYGLSTTEDFIMQPTIAQLSNLAPGLLSGGNIIQEATFRSENFPVDVGSTAAFLLEGHIAVKPLQSAVTLTITRNIGTNPVLFVVNGSVQNTTDHDLQDVVVIAAGSMYKIGYLAVGETKEFTFSGQPLNLTANFSFNNPAPYQPAIYLGYNPNDEYASFMRDLFGENYYKLITEFPNIPEMQEVRRRLLFLSSIVMSNDPNEGRGVGVYLMGWTTASPLAVELENFASQTDSSTLWVYQLPVTIKPDTATQDITLPPSLVTWAVGADSPRRDLTPQRITLNLGEFVTFTFKPLAALPLSNVNTIQIDVDSYTNASNTGKISVWDWQKQNWEPALIGADGRVTIRSPQAFLDATNAVRVRIEPNPLSNLNFLEFTNLRVTLFGKLAN